MSKNKIIPMFSDEKIMPYNFEKILSLESLLSESILKKNKPESNPKRKYTLAVTRNQEGSLQVIESDTNRFQSERNIDYSNCGIMFGPGWLADRVMEEIPLYVSAENVTSRKVSSDYSRLPTDLTDILNQGILRISGIKQTDYSILMSVTEKNEGKPPEGRTGVLLYKGTPVVVRLGDKEFAVEIKGVGCPDGDNSRIEQMCRSDYFGQGHEEYGGFDEDEGRREFKLLEAQRKTKTFQDGDSVRAAALISYQVEKTNKLGETKRTRQAYLIRLTPSNIRSSFNSNQHFPKVEDREMLLTTSVGQHYAELAKLRGNLLHSTIHPENIVWTGSRYVLTDFADCRRLRDIEDPHDYLRHVLEKIKEVPGLTERGVNNFYATIAQELGAHWDINTGYSGFIDSVWSDFFASKVYDLRKGKEDRANRQLEAARELLKTYDRKEQPLSWLFVNGAKHFLEQESDVLKHINTPEAVESLRIARSRISYLEVQLKDGTEINRRFAEDATTYFSLFLLPYMKQDR